MLSTAQADPTPWLPLPDLDGWVDGEPPAETERANNYYRARYYDPKIGRFISEDPIRFAGGINFYAYVENNPVDNTDPNGLFRFPLPTVPAPVVTGVTAAGAATAAAVAGVGLVVIALANEYEQAQALALTEAEIIATSGNRCKTKKRNCWNVGSGGCMNNAGKPGAPPGLSKRCNYACDDGTSWESYVPCRWKGDSPSCPAP